MKKEEEKSTFRKFLIPTIFSIVLFGLTIAFFFLLSEKTNHPFGFAEIIYSILLGIFFFLVFVWLQSFFAKNKYLASAVSLFFLLLLVRGIMYKFSGINTTIFLVIGGIIFVTFIVLSFLLTKRI